MRFFTAVRRRVDATRRCRDFAVDMTSVWAAWGAGRAINAGSGVKSPLCGRLGVRGIFLSPGIIPRCEDITEIDILRDRIIRRDKFLVCDWPEDFRYFLGLE